MKNQVALNYLLKKEYSMGNGQCPECHGCNPKLDWWTEMWGHRKGCELEAAISSLGGKTFVDFVPSDSDRGEKGLILRKELLDWQRKRKEGQMRMPN